MRKLLLILPALVITLVMDVILIREILNDSGEGDLRSEWAILVVSGVFWVALLVILLRNRMKPKEEPPA